MQRTGGQVVIDTLRAGGVRTVFGIPGVHNLSMYDALYRSDDIEHIVCRHEQGAGFAADGYARTSGMPGVFITTTGPGATNAFTALGEAWADTSPVLLIASQLPSNLINRNRGVVHELEDQPGTFRQVTRSAESISHVSEISPALARVLAELKTGRPRPAYFDVPENTLNRSSEVEIVTPERPAEYGANAEYAGRVAELLHQAKRPVILAGSGVHRSGASASLLSLAETIQAPVFETAQGRGAIPGDHPLAVGGKWTGSPELEAFLTDSDAVLVVGTRLSQADTSGWTLKLSPVIHIDADGEWVGLNYPASIALIGNERLVLNQILDALEGSPGAADSGWSEQIAAAGNTLEEAMRREHPVPMSVIDAIDRAAPRDRIITNDSLIEYWTARHLPVYEDRSFHIPWIYGTLGTALPFAIGSAVAAPERPVIAVTGDGALMFSIAELATAVQIAANITVVVCNDHGYGAMRRHQRLRYGDYTYATDLATPDFAALARSFGATGLSLRSPDELEAAITEALDTAGPVVIDMPLALDVPWM